MSLTGQIKRIEISRPWMDPLVLRSRAWRWSPASPYYGALIATGANIAGGIAARGPMPVLTKTALFARNIKITLSEDIRGRDLSLSDDTSGLREFGPFRLGTAKLIENHITVPDPQVIGYLSEILPLLPNPDPALPWPLMGSLPDRWPFTRYVKGSS